MNVISLHQPYASLVMAGIKTWETRGNPPHGDMCPEGVRGLPGRRINAGDRILIHAARTWAPGWLRWYSPERSDADSDRLNVLESVGVDFHECGDNWWKIDTRSLPLGAILGSVRVERVLPVGSMPGCEYLADDLHVCLNGNGRLDLVDHDNGDDDITDQVPFGNWKPGTWAWELADPIPTTEQCPACDGDGWYIDSTGSPTRCYVCETSWTCPPIPVTGKQGVWEWK